MALIKKKLNLTRQSVASFLCSVSASVDMRSNSLHVQGEPRKHDDWLCWRELHKEVGVRKEGELK